MRRRITRQMFERQWVRDNPAKTTLREQRAFGRLVKPCNCDYPGCEGWQMVYREGVLAR